MKSPQKLVNSKTKCQSLTSMNNSTKAKDNLNKIASKKALINFSPSKIQFNFRVK